MIPLSLPRFRAACPLGPWLLLKKKPLLEGGLKVLTQDNAPVIRTAAVDPLNDQTRFAASSVEPEGLPGRTNILLWLAPLLVCLDAPVIEAVGQHPVIDHEYPVPKSREMLEGGNIVLGHSLTIQLNSEM